jgi:hypothetical protein
MLDGTYHVVTCDPYIGMRPAHWWEYAAVVAPPRTLTLERVADWRQLTDRERPHRAGRRATT